MDSSSVPTGGSQNYSTDAPNRSLLDQVVDATPRHLEYLRGKEQAVGKLGKWALLGIGGIFAYINQEAIVHFAKNIVDLQMQLIYGCGGFIALMLLWKMLSHPKFYEICSMLVDSVMYKAHYMWVVRNKEDAARWAIRQLKKLKKLQDFARGQVEAALNAVSATANSAQADSIAAAQTAAALEAEINRRQRDPNSRPANRDLGKLPEDQLEVAFENAKSEARAHYDLFKTQSAQAAVLEKRCSALKEVGNATSIKVHSAEVRLGNAIKSRDLAFQSMTALEASSDMVGGAANETFNTAVDLIITDTNSYNGRSRVLMDLLDPTVQSYRLNKIAGAIADEDFYKDFLNSNPEVDPQVQRKLLAPVSTPVIHEVERLLGRTTSGGSGSSPATGAGRPAAHDEFGDLLK